MLALASHDANSVVNGTIAFLSQVIGNEVQHDFCHAMPFASASVSYNAHGVITLLHLLTIKMRCYMTLW